MRCRGKSDPSVVAGDKSLLVKSEKVSEEVQNSLPDSCEEAKLRLGIGIGRCSRNVRLVIIRLGSRNYNIGIDGNGCSLVTTGQTLLMLLTGDIAVNLFVDNPDDIVGADVFLLPHSQRCQ